MDCAGARTRALGPAGFLGEFRPSFRWVPAGVLAAAPRSTPAVTG
ncbi:hypothetical protein [Streptomyces sp. NPDC052701]